MNRPLPLPISATVELVRCRAARVTTALAAVIVTGALLASITDAPAVGHELAAHDAAVLSGSVKASLHLVKPEGSQLIEEGSVSGALIGSVRATLHTGAVFTSIFLIRTRAGTITGRGQATPHGTGRYQSFGGSFLATNGSGRYAHIQGRAGLYGVFDRRTDSVVIQTTGQLTY